MQICVTSLFNLDKTIFKDYLSNFDTPWLALSGIKEYISELGKSLPSDKYKQISENVWVAKSASISPTAHIGGFCIIDEGAEIRHGAFIRSSAIVGKGAVVGNSTELKNCILFDSVQVPHFNYVGDSILGYKAHLGAGAVTSNVKSDKSTVTVKTNTGRIETGLKKFGAIIGDYSEVGCNTVLCPGTVLGRNVTVYPTSMVRGFVRENSIFKNDSKITDKR